MAKPQVKKSRSNGEVWTWGGNDVGQLGDGTHTDRAAPARNLAGYGTIQVSAGGSCALARRPGSVWARSANDGTAIVTDKGLAGEGTETFFASPAWTWT